MPRGYNNRPRGSSGKRSSVAAIGRAVAAESARPSQQAGPHGGPQVSTAIIKNSASMLS